MCIYCIPFIQFFKDQTPAPIALCYVLHSSSCQRCAEAASVASDYHDDDVMNVNERFSEHVVVVGRDHRDADSFRCIVIQTLRMRK